MPLTINPRRPFNDDQPNGLLESAKDYVLNNVWLAEALLEVLELLAALDKQNPGHSASFKLYSDANGTLYLDDQVITFGAVDEVVSEQHG